MDPLAADVLSFLGAAASAGVVGNASYHATGRLATWAGERLGWTPGSEAATRVDPPLAQSERELACSLLAAARVELHPVLSQNIRIGGDNSGHIIAANGDVRISEL